MSERGKKSLIVVSSEDAGARLDVFLAARPELDLSRAQAQRLIAQGLVFVNDQGAKASLKLAAQDQVTVSIPPPEPLEVRPQEMPLNVVYEDEHLLVVDKPAGLVVHPAPGHREGTLVNALLAHCGSELARIGPLLRSGIVHRLDKDTSGLLVVAKSAAAYQQLVRAMKAREVQRVYLCLAHGSIKGEVATVDAPIGRHHHHRKKMAVVPGGRSARTHIRVLERFHDYTYLEVTLETGRTHQIRVHLAFIGHPVVGDQVYGRLRETLKLKRQFLHAARLSFLHPITGEGLNFQSDLPSDLTETLEQIRADCNKKFQHV
ncbi:MAG: RluA family pseudouridine synthase [bacterium]